MSLLVTLAWSTWPCSRPVAETVDRLESLLKAKGIKIFARIDQIAEARAAGLTMRPTVLLIFGDPNAGTPLMNRHPSIAIDLPLKALVRETADRDGLAKLQQPRIFAAAPWP